MKRSYHILYSTLLTLLVIIMSSCQDNTDIMPTGSLYLEANQDATILTKTNSAVTTEPLQIDIINVAGETVKHFSDYISEVKGKSILLPVGTYTISVRSNQSEGAAWEKPFYAGSEEVEIRSNTITAASVTCKITNTKVTVNASNLANYFSDYQTTVSNSSGSLVYTRDEYRAGFFKAEKLTAVLELTNADGNHFSLTRVFPDIEERYAYEIKYLLQDPTTPTDPETAGANFSGITIDQKADTIYYGIYIKEDDLAFANVPKITSTGFEDGKISFKKVIEEGVDQSNIPDHSIKLYAPNGIQRLTVTADSHQFANEGISSFDLCNLGTEQAFLDQLKFPTENLTDHTEVTLDLKAFASNLMLTSETQKISHSFTITLLDNSHQEAVYSFGYELQPNVSAYVINPDGYTTFAVLKGYCIDKDANFVIQPEGGSPVPIKTNILWEEDKNENMSALVIGLIPGVTYEYWIEAPTLTKACEHVTFTVKAASEVPNLSFDDWTKNTYGNLNAPLVGGWKSYLSPNNEESLSEFNGWKIGFWDSGNLGAQAGDAVLTDKTDDIAIKNTTNKYAAKLSSTRVEKLGMGAFSAGSIFSGNPVDVSSSGGSLKYGKNYQGYPIYLHGYYKYTSGKINWVDNKNQNSDEVDECIFNIALCLEPQEVKSLIKNASTGEVGEVKPFNYQDESTVFAYGTATNNTIIEDGNAEKGENGYKPFKIRLNYRWLLKDPKESFYIVIMMSSSKKGDYFTGSTNSVLYIDELSLDYNYDAEAFKNTELSKYKPININE